MTREVAHLQQFTAALNSIEENFPPGKLPGDDRFTTLAFNMSNGGADRRGPWNEGQGPWPDGVEWDYVDDPAGKKWAGSARAKNKGADRSPGGSPDVESERVFSHQEHVPVR
jgi:Mn-containing catalase